MGKIRISIPKDLSEVTLGQYQEYLKIADKHKDEEESGDFLNLKALEIFCDLDMKESHSLPLKHFHFALSHLESLFEAEPKFVNRFVFRTPDGDQEMGFIPKLDDMTFGEYVDLDKYMSDWQKMHRAMAVLFRPVRVKMKDSYEIDEYTGTGVYGDAMKEMPLNIALGAVVFFYRLGTKLLRNIPTFLERQKGLSKKKKEDLQRIGDGIRRFSLFAEAMYSESMTRQKFLYTRG